MSIFADVLNQAYLMFLPEDFIEQTKQLLGEETDSLIAAFKEPIPVSIRLNPAKISAKVLEGMLPIFSGSVSWSSAGKYLKERPAFTFDPFLHAGCYYVQEASSMFVEQALRQALKVMGANKVRMLDLCAAPGGKSTLAASVLPEGSLLVANELIRTRANILAENLIKWGNPNVVVTQSDSSAFSGLTNFFDIILTDVPCSGEGLFRKDPDSISEWSVDNVKLCASRQRAILNNCWTALRPGGCLIYSTCTYNTMENEENIRWICDELGARLLEIPVRPEWGITGSLGDFSIEERLDLPNDAGQEAGSFATNFPVYRFLPHKTKGEGFFLALLQKDGSEVEVPNYRRSFKEMLRSDVHKGKVKNKKSFDLSESVRNLLKNPDTFDFSLDHQGRIRAFPKNQVEAVGLLEEKLRIVNAGILMGERKGKDFLPDISLALSTALDSENVQTCSLSLRDAISYLRRESLVLPETCPLGWVLICYEAHPLGWMKNIGNRANNTYPNEWRIRSENPYKS